MTTHLIAPSILSADFSRMGEAVSEIQNAEADWVHIDVMDGIFVPNLTFGPKMVGDLRPYTDLPFDVHLMIEKPEQLIPAFAEAGADYITYHLEAVVHAHRTVQLIRSLGKKPGVSIVPSTPVSLLTELLPFVDQVLIMTVNPGFGGQNLIETCLDKIRSLAAIRKELNLNFLIAADGGINIQTSPKVRNAGTDVLIAGSAFFSAADKKQFVKVLKGIS
ncbi:MAG TPA: ribulose-phosphate 3-epimerase [Treponema sp.]|nr:ribulose-phosphate 3-epimerase [Treponema sp.]HPC70456.1 ribulose-phosphate 3-epimerase [Treponema sp.]HRS02993.1 ribulose-phosphate 3-epimerase [Treponema sp.]HRU27722.1 ribulose-phosphate 3-epimerase [Treponema sp.]